jgi:isopentenyl phosphate kinase
MKPYVVKLGGSVITDKKKKFFVRKEVLSRLAREISKSKRPLVIVHGGGSFGHPLAAEYKIADGFTDNRQLMGFALTHRAMEELNTHVVKALRAVGSPAIAVQPSATVVVRNEEIVSMDVRPIKNLLELGLVPVLYGDTVPDLKKGMSILSGDQLAVYLTKALHAQRLIVAADVNGVYTSDPRVDGKAKLLRKITPADRNKLSFYRDKRVKDVTGGMRNKVEELLDLAKSGIESEIANAMKPGILERLVKGERGLGTVIRK